MKNGRLFRDSPLGNYVSGCYIYSNGAYKSTVFILFIFLRCYIHL